LAQFHYPTLLCIILYRSSRCFNLRKSNPTERAHLGIPNRKNVNHCIKDHHTHLRKVASCKCIPKS
jgi:hypothetical protein